MRPSQGAPSGTHVSFAERAIRALCPLALAALALAAPAQAAFPGANGKIVFNTDGGDIDVVNPDGSGLTALTSGADFDDSPAWSADGTKIAFSSYRAGNYDIYVMNADGSGVTRLTTASTIEREPAWSPDGTKIAFRLDQTPSNTEIYTMNADGSGQTNLTNNPATDASPAWSPDGQRIAFSSNRNTGVTIWTMKPDGTEPTELTTSFDSYAPNWSPDGSKIAFHIDTDSEGTDVIHVMNADGSNETPIAGSNYHYRSPAWSPDGLKIAFVYDFFDPTLRVMDASGAGTSTLTSGDEPDWQPLPTGSYHHPQSASQLNVSIVPTFRPCGTGASPTNGQHFPPLGTQSCLPPVPGSNVARVGSTSVASTSFTVLAGDTDPTNGDQADVSLAASLTDVKTPAGADYVPNPSGPDLTEITRLRLTDKANNYGGASGTATEYDFRVPIECVATTDPALGSSCSANTSADALLPGFITEQRQTVFQAFRVRVDDAGANGTTGDSDDRIFATQGIYIP